MNCNFNIPVLLSFQYLLNILFINSILVKFHFCNKTSQADLLSICRQSSFGPWGFRLKSHDYCSVQMGPLWCLSRDTSSHASSFKQIATHFPMSVKMNTVTSKEALCCLVFVSVTSRVDVLICHISIWWPDIPGLPARMSPHFSDLGLQLLFPLLWQLFLLTYAHRSLLEHLLSIETFPRPLVSIWALLLPSPFYVSVTVVFLTQLDLWPN